MAIRHKRTTTTGYTWQSGDTVEGQIGLNLTDGTLHFKKSNGDYVALSQGGGGLTDIVQDTTPQLGGNLDVNGNSIVSASNGDIAITPNGTGSVIIDGNEFPQAIGAAGEILTADGSGLVEWKLNQTLSAQVYNADSVTINKGEPVYVFSSTGTNISVKRALNTGDSTSAQTLGLANESIAAGATGIVICQGLLKGVDTSAYTAGQAIYLGATAGTVTTTKPKEPNHLVYLGFVETVNAVSGRIYVRTQNGYELDEIHDVNINNATALDNNHYLRYNSTNTRWENAALDIINDTTPQLGGALDVNGNTITSASNGNVEIAPNGTGDVYLTADTVRVGDANAAATITTNGTGNLILNTNSGTNSGSITIAQGSNGNITVAPNGTGDVYLNADTIYVGDGSTSANTITSQGTGIFTIGSGGTVKLNSDSGAFDAASLSLFTGDGSSVVSRTDISSTLRVTNNGIGGQDSTGLLLKGLIATSGTVTGGAITIVGAANGNITITPDGTGQTVIKNLEYNENVFAYGNSGTLTWTPNATNGNVQTITLTGNLTLNAFTSPVSGQTITFIITQDATGSRTLTSTMKFAGASKTLSTAANSIDILTVSYIGTTYYATLSKGYA